MIRSNKGQITIFVIVGMLLVSAVVLFYILYQNNALPGSKKTDTTQQTVNDCIGAELEETVNQIILNVGNSEESKLVKNYSDKQVPYLCYTALDYARCTPQTGILMNNLEEEITMEMQSKVNGCFEQLKTHLDSNAYESFIGNDQNISVNVIPGKVIIAVDREVNQQKGDRRESFNHFSFILNSPLQIMNSVTHEIISQEIKLCNSDYIELMRIHPSIEITKFNTGDDVKIYTIKDKESDNGWSFALRNCVLATPG